MSAAGAPGTTACSTRERELAARAWQLRVAWTGPNEIGKQRGFLHKHAAGSNAAVRRAATCHKKAVGAFGTTVALLVRARARARDTIFECYHNILSIIVDHKTTAEWNALRAASPESCLLPCSLCRIYIISSLRHHPKGKVSPTQVTHGLR